ncbi:unnamed protein product, partial [Prorocentrum cordatum]
AALARGGSGASWAAAPAAGARPKGPIAARPGGRARGGGRAMLSPPESPECARRGRRWAEYRADPAGDFLDGLVEPLVQGLVAQLRPHYQRELQRMRRQLEAARGVPEGPCGESAAAGPREAEAPPPPGIGFAGLASFQSEGSTAGPRAVRLPVVDVDPVWNRMSSCDSSVPDALAMVRQYPPTSLEDDFRAVHKVRMDEVDALKRAADWFEKQRVAEARGDLGISLPGAPQAAFGLSARAHGVVSWAYFETLMGAVIVANALTIGAEASASAQGQDAPPLFSVCEYAFLAIYVAEICLRFAAFGVRASTRSHWVKLDIFLVVAGLANSVLTVTSVSGEAANDIVGKINMMKLFRLIRLCRVARLVVHFRTLWLLVHCLLYSITPMLWTAGVMIVVVYVFAIFGMEFIIAGAFEDEDYVMASSKFSSLWSSMLTLWQFMFVDGAAAIYKPLVSRSPLLALYFLAFFLVGPVALLNIRGRRTAIMVESSLRIAKEDQQAKNAWMDLKKREMIPKLHALFKGLDLNGDGLVSLAELKASPPELKEQIQRIVQMEQLESIFHLLDLDCAGSISIDEFVDGLMRSLCDEKPSELILLVSQNRNEDHEHDAAARLQDRRVRAPGWTAGAERSGGGGGARLLVQVDFGAAPCPPLQSQRSRRFGQDRAGMTLPLGCWSDPRASQRARGARARARAAARAGLLCKACLKNSRATLPQSGGSLCQRPDLYCHRHVFSSAIFNTVQVQRGLDAPAAARPRASRQHERARCYGLEQARAWLGSDAPAAAHPRAPRQHERARGVVWSKLF